MENEHTSIEQVEQHAWNVAVEQQNHNFETEVQHAAERIRMETLNRMNRTL